MEILGISLQLAAGIIFGLAHILPPELFKKVNEILHRFLTWPLSEQRRILKIALSAPLFGLVILFCFFAMRDSSNLEWYEALFGIIMSVSLAGIVYYQLLQTTFTLFKRHKKLDILFREKRFLFFLFANLAVLILCLLIASINIPALTKVADLASTESAWQVFFIILGAILALLMALLYLSAFAALVFITIAGVLQISASVTRPMKQILWPSVLILYVAGGAILLANAISSS